MGDLYDSLSPPTQPIKDLICSRFCFSGEMRLAANQKLIEENIRENSHFRFHFQAVVSHEKDEVVTEKLFFTEPSVHSGKHTNLVISHSTSYSYHSILPY